MYVSVLKMPFVWPAIWLTTVVCTLELACAQGRDKLQFSRVHITYLMLLRCASIDVYFQCYFFRLKANSFVTTYSTSCHSNAVISFLSVRQKEIFQVVLVHDRSGQWFILSTCVHKERQKRTSHSFHCTAFPLFFCVNWHLCPLCSCLTAFCTCLNVLKKCHFI